MTRQSNTIVEKDTNQWRLTFLTNEKLNKEENIILFVATMDMLHIPSLRIEAAANWQGSLYIV